MTGKERVLKAMRCEPVDRIPWVPFVGCHAGALLGMAADEYLKSSKHIIDGVNASIQRYDPDGIPVAFDLQVEAEILGCDLTWAKENPPAVSKHVLSQGVALEDLRVPRADQGRLKEFLDAARNLSSKHPDRAVYGLITGPFTLALHLLGTDIFLKMFDDEPYIHRLMAFCRDVAVTTAGYYLDAGCSIVAVVDPMTSQIGPDVFEQFVTPYALPVFESIRSRGAMGSFFVCGHAQQNLDVMCRCRPDNVCVDENIPLTVVKEICTKHRVSFGGNLQLTTVLLLGKPADAQKNAIECMDIGGQTGFILAPGCDLPYAVPPENLCAVTEIVQDEYKREIARTMSVTQAQQCGLDMREYGQADRVIVDIITLDSEACAPCQYMVEAVKKVAPEFEGLVEWREHKIKYRESLVFMNSLMVRNVPTICIDGIITFVSRIPARDELVAAIQQRIYDKVRTRIQRRRALVLVLGDGGEQCQKLQANVETAIAELGAEVEVRMVTDELEILRHGVSPRQTPVAVVAKYQVKSSRRVPETAIIKEWIKDVL